MLQLTNTWSRCPLYIHTAVSQLPNYEKVCSEMWHRGSDHKLITLAFGNDGLFSVFVDADDDVETFLSVDGDGGRSVLVVKSLAPPGGKISKLKLMKFQVS